MNKFIYFILIISIFGCKNNYYESPYIISDSIENESKIEYDSIIQEENLKKYIPVYEIDLNDSTIQEENLKSYDPSNMIPEYSIDTNSIDTNSIKITKIINTDSVLNNDIEYGTLVYNIDSIFFYNVLYRVKAKISSIHHNKITTEIVKEFNITENEKINLKINSIKVSEVMNMELNEITPNTFIITSLSSKDQSIEKGWTTWEWSVLPLKPGKYNLKLRAIVKTTKGYNSDIVVFDKKITVKIKNKTSWIFQKFNSSLDLIQDYWFILSVFLIPLFTWIYKKKKKKKL